jgi:hypothetical protein
MPFAAMHLRHSRAAVDALNGCRRHIATVTPGGPSWGRHLSKDAALAGSWYAKRPVGLSAWCETHHGRRAVRAVKPDTLAHLRRGSICMLMDLYSRCNHALPVANAAKQVEHHSSSSNKRIATQRV